MKPWIVVLLSIGVCFASGCSKTADSTTGATDSPIPQSGVDDPASAGQKPKQDQPSQSPGTTPTAGTTVRTSGANIVITDGGVSTPAGSVSVSKDGVKVGGTEVKADGVKTPGGNVTVTKDGVKTPGVTVKVPIGM